MTKPLKSPKTRRPEEERGGSGSITATSDDEGNAVFGDFRDLVHSDGLEPSRLAAYAPQTYVSTNSTTSAFRKR